MNWMVLPLKRYADFSGRSRRLEFWMYALLNIVVIVGIVMVGYTADRVMSPDDAMSNGGTEAGAGGAVVGIVLMLWFVGTIVPNIALIIRRLHDQDKTGWLYLITVIPYIGWVFLLIFACVDGTHGENQYGEDPKDSFSDDIFS